MNKEEKKEINKKLEQEQLNLEREFNKTPKGKLMNAVAIIVIIVMILGLLMSFAYHVFDLEQSVQDFAGHCIKFSGGFSFFFAIFYVVILPSMKKEQPKKKDKEDKRDTIQETKSIILYGWLICVIFNIINGIILKDLEMILFLTLIYTFVFGLGYIAVYLWERLVINKTKEDGNK